MILICCFSWLGACALCVFARRCRCLLGAHTSCSCIGASDGEIQTDIESTHEYSEDFEDGEYADESFDSVS